MAEERPEILNDDNAHEAMLDDKGALLLVLCVEDAPDEIGALLALCVDDDPDVCDLLLSLCAEDDLEGCTSLSLIL